MVPNANWMQFVWMPNCKTVKGNYKEGCCFPSDYNWLHPSGSTQRYEPSRASNEPFTITRYISLQSHTTLSTTYKFLVGAFSVITNLRVDLRLKFYYEPSVEEVVQECLGPGVPATRLLDTARWALIGPHHTTSSPLIGCSGAAVAELETNARLERALGRLSLPRATELVLPSSGARVQLLLPPGYREADDFTFPLLVFL